MFVGLFDVFKADFMARKRPSKCAHLRACTRIILIIWVGLVLTFLVSGRLLAVLLPKTSQPDFASPATARLHRLQEAAWIG